MHEKKTIQENVMNVTELLQVPVLPFPYFVSSIFVVLDISSPENGLSLHL